MSPERQHSLISDADGDPYMGGKLRIWGNLKDLWQILFCISKNKTNMSHKKMKLSTSCIHILKPMFEGKVGKGGLMPKKKPKMIN